MHFISSAMASFCLETTVEDAMQTVRDEGPATHRIKNGTPTMGGVLFSGRSFCVLPALWKAVPQNTPGRISDAGALGLWGFWMTISR